MTTRGQHSYTRSELAEVADGLERLLDAISRGELIAGSGAVARLEGAMIALRALAEGRAVGLDELDGSAG